MRLHFTAALVTAIILTGCDPQTKQEHQSAQAVPAGDVAIIDSNTVELKTSTGKTILLTETHPNGRSLVTLKAEAVGFGSSATLTLEDIDPITGIKKTDLDGNGFEEIYIFTTAAGSGSYGMVHAILSLGDTALTTVSLPAPEPNDELFRGYMGHDIFMIQEKVITRTFPVFKEGDSNASPTGGSRIIEYELENENGAWSIRVAE